MITSLILAVLVSNDASRIGALVEDLGSPNVEVRDLAATDLCALGKFALPELNEHLDANPGVARVAGIIREIVDEIVKDLRLSMTPLRSIRAGRPGCLVQLTEPKALSKIFPGCRILTATYECSCCYMACGVERVVGISERDGSSFMIRRCWVRDLPVIGDARRLGRYLKPVSTCDEAIEVVSAITGVATKNADLFALFAWEVGDTIIARAPGGREFHFDAKGRLDRIAVDDQPSWHIRSASASCLLFRRRSLH